MKKVFIVSQVLLAINLFILIIPTSILLVIFSLFPSLKSFENGLGAYPLFFIVCGITGLIVTIPFSFIMIILYMWYKYRAKA
ncbi:hypothetical protein A5821_001123 [Enterococcus sp. 7F3_DIV0205]|uniref:Uncharacterized protein n=1 Tax=Candidatus Enterococcus palustris TaxID=1834189 RepID=A0AAQ3W783_9ENTE|nr:hypothetical protein A5821_001466 [Enterococcus sp. 7F3_DIV0205]